MAPQFIQFDPQAQSFQQGYQTFAGLDEVFNRALQMGVQQKEQAERLKMAQRQQEMQMQQMAQEREMMFAGQGIEPGPNALQQYIQQQKQAASAKDPNLRPQEQALYERQFGMPAGSMAGVRSDVAGRFVSPVLGQESKQAALDAKNAAAQTKAAELAEIKRQANESVKKHASDVIGAADSAMARIGMNTTGIGGAIMSRLPGSERNDLEGFITTMKSSMAFDRLQEMRNQSKTGGALGQVSDNELRLLANNVAALDMNQSPAVLRANTVKIKRDYEDIVRRMNAPAGAAAPGGATPKQSAEDIIKSMSGKPRAEIKAALKAAGY